MTANNPDMKQNEVMKNQSGCPHELYGLDMKIVSALEKQPDGRWRCKFCGAMFDSPEDAKKEEVKE